MESTLSAYEPIVADFAHYRMEADVFTRSVLLLVIVFVPVAVFAQSPPAPPPPGWDVAATAGLFAGYRPPVDGGSGYQERWFHAVHSGVTVGRYLGTHLKVEVEASTTSGGMMFRERLVRVPDVAQPYIVGSEVTTSVPTVGASLTWQFRNNEWVHPFVLAGIAAEFDRSTMRTWDPFVFGSSPPGAPSHAVYQERIEGPTTTRAVRGVLGGGAKVYFSQRGFVRTDGRWSLDRERHNVALRLGVGIDF